jgi:hypothetical protein
MKGIKGTILRIGTVLFGTAAYALIGNGDSRCGLKDAADLLQEFA